MGMTIDLARREMIFSKPYTDKFAMALDVAIDVMRKYQNIEQIIKDHDNDRMPEDYWYIDKIREVIEDGKTD